ncbi:MAG: nickel-dependent lactate racemase [Planctomycetota bacterium]|nr:nickel-dependent lactate racemase [Planctomycetota bacterium]
MKTVSLQFGDGQIEIRLPDAADILTAKKATPLSDPAASIRRSLDRPIGCPALCKLAAGADSAAVVVSDNTRPIPYKGPAGVLPPIIETLQRSGVKDVKIIIACGTHRLMEPDEIRDMLGPSAFQKGIEVINHVATDEFTLRCIGSTDRTPNITVNKHYLDARLKIATGLVEPHFMAGFSGGRKAICPGICGENVTYGFHSAAMLNEEGATGLKLNGNPCHEEALRIAGMAGVDFIVNVAIDCEKRLTGVFGGALEEAHLAAAEHVSQYSVIELDKLYDVVIMPAGYIGVNHYQCAKAAYESSRAARPGGKIILVGHLKERQPIGGRNYKDMLRLLACLGPAGFMNKILSDDWTFVPDQWQVQMWAKAFAKLGGSKNLYICAPRLEDSPEDLIPEVNVAAQTKRMEGESDVDFAERSLQQTVEQVIVPSDSVLVLPDGPYSIPVLSHSAD